MKEKIQVGGYEKKVKISHVKIKKMTRLCFMDEGGKTGLLHASMSDAFIRAGSA